VQQHQQEIPQNPTCKARFWLKPPEYLLSFSPRPKWHGNGCVGLFVFVIQNFALASVKHRKASVTCDDK
jgi:hypothetical protein